MVRDSIVTLLSGMLALIVRDARWGVNFLKGSRHRVAVFTDPEIMQGMDERLGSGAEKFSFLELAMLECAFDMVAVYR